MVGSRSLPLAFVLVAIMPALGVAQAQRTLLPIEFEHSAEFGWLNKPVHATRTLDDMTRPDSWRFTGTGTITFPTELRLGGMRVLRVGMQMVSDARVRRAHELQCFTSSVWSSRGTFDT